MTKTNIVIVCAWCKEMAQEDGAWINLRWDAAVGSGVTVSHGVCPECSSAMFTELKAHQAAVSTRGRDNSE